MRQVVAQFLPLRGILFDQAHVVADAGPLLERAGVAARCDVVAGSFFDSLLGATLQASYLCLACDRRTEARRHRCGTATQRVAGLAWLDNDGVNFAASVMGAAVAAVVAG